MTASTSSAVELVEVGPRDGFQAIDPFIPTARKIDFVRRLVAAGLRRIEVGSVVSKDAVPQLSDTADLLSAIADMDGLRPQVLVPSARRCLYRKPHPY
jgi:hydroxymethylglutaryl-CoA lyase